MRRISTCALIICAAACVKAKDNGAFRPLDVGAAVPAYAISSLAGDTIRVGAGTAPTVLNVWATWCTSCKEEMAALDSLKRQYESRGLRVVAVSVDKGGAELVRRFAESNHLGMTVAHDPDAVIEQSYQVVGVPTTFVIGRDGMLVWRHTGNITDVLPEVRDAINKAISR